MLRSPQGTETLLALGGRGGTGLQARARRGSAAPVPAGLDLHKDELVRSYPACLAPALKRWTLPATEAGQEHFSAHLPGLLRQNLSASISAKKPIANSVRRYTCAASAHPFAPRLET